MSIAGLLDRNTEELGSLLRALNGEYVLPEAGGDLLRDGAGVLPTGESFKMPLRNGHKAAGLPNLCTNTMQPPGLHVHYLVFD